MRVLVADDNSMSLRILERTLQKAEYEVVAAEDGDRAWEILRSDPTTQLAVLDWMMPGLDGIEICRRLRAPETPGYVYVLLLTAKGQREDIVAGLEAGADDYVTKPFDAAELLLRIRVGERIIALESGLEEKVRELEDALAHVNQLQGLLPICMHCKKIRDDQDTWHRLESYIQNHADVMFTHSLCAECRDVHYPARRR